MGKKQKATIHGAVPAPATPTAPTAPPTATPNATAK
jgi:hypothetical protein